MTENFCQESLFIFFKYLVDSVLMSQHYYWTQLENHLCLRMSSMGQWSELDDKTEIFVDISRTQNKLTVTKCKRF